MHVEHILIHGFKTLSAAQMDIINTTCGCCAMSQKVCCEIGTLE